MTANEQRQVRNSVIAIVLCIVFLWSGKKFIWNNAVASDPNAGSSSTASEPVESSEDSFEPLSTTTTSTAPVPPETTSSPADTTGAAGVDTTAANTYTQDTTVSTTTTAVTTSTTTATQTQAPIGDFVQAPEGYFNDALFVGDSRTVGMANYAPLSGATYFATTGLAAHKVYSVTSEVATTKGQTFSQVLASRTFGKVYVMLGINEIGNNRTATLQQYQDLLSKIRAAQPNAIIIIQANLHVAQSRSSTDAIVNNTQINSFNEAIASFADGVTSFYLDVNPIFDDENGALRAEYTHDGTHPLAKYYKDWDAFLEQHAIV